MPDPVLRHRYSAQLEAAAEGFLLSAFEGESQPFGERAEPSPTLISAAMHILTRSAWTQPSDEQVKAAMFLSTRPERHDDDYRDAA